MVGAALLLAGCGLTSEGQALRDAVSTKGAAAYDAGLANAEWFICQAASVGSVRRRYGSGELADAYRELCENGSTEGILVPSAPPAGVAQ